MREVTFGTGGWRAVIGDGFTRENVQRLSYALALRMKREDADGRGLVIGYDRRFLSRQAAEWIAEVMAAAGVRALVINREAPTPLVMFTVMDTRAHYGACVTASHNPALYNGVKLFTRGGRDAEERVTTELAAAISALPREDVPFLPYADALRQGRVEEIDPQNAYLDAIIRAVNMDAIRSRGLHVILDPMYGVSRTSLQTILLTARCDVEIIHERHDTLFGGRLPAPNSDTLRALQAYVLETRADIGIATDGDADRLGIIDDTGRFVHPNEILVALYEYLVRCKGWHGPAVRNLATTHILDRVARAFGEECFETPVGFKHISAAMREHNAVIGGESSGGLTVRGHIPGKDGIYAASLLVEMLAVTGMRLSEILKRISDTYGALYMAEHDYPFRPDDRPRMEAMLRDENALPPLSANIAGVKRVDGVKYLLDGGWLIARFSGTEPRVRIFCEMPDAARAEALAKEAAAWLGVA